MEFSDFWLKSKNGAKVSKDSLKELKKSDLKGNSALIKLFNFFDTQKADGTSGSDGVLNASELNSLFGALSNAAKKTGQASVFEIEDAKSYLETTTSNGRSLKNLGINAADMFSFLSLFTKPKYDISSLPIDISLSDNEAKEHIITEIINDVTFSQSIIAKQDNGIVSDWYNNLKEYFDSDLSLSNVEEAVLLQKQGAENLYRAKNGELSKREYFLQNRLYLKKLMHKRLFRKDENTGLDFLDRNRGTLSKADFAKKMEEYINMEIDKINKLDSIKSMQQSLLLLTDAGADVMLKNLKERVESSFSPKAEEKYNSINAPEVPIEYDTDELMTFEEVFKLERNVEYQKENVERYLEQKQRTSYAVGAFNKYQSFKAQAEQVTSSETSELKAYNIAELFSNYYNNFFNPDLPKEKLQELINENDLPLTLNTDKDGNITISFSKVCNDKEKNDILDNLMKIHSNNLENELKNILGGNIDDRMLALSQASEAAYNNAFGRDFTLELTENMADDNKTFIQRYTGESTTWGIIAMGAGVLCLTNPITAPGSIYAFSIGNTLMLGGMAAESALGYTEAFTRTNLNEDEVKELNKTLITNAGGFVVGFAAGKVGMKAFNKLIDKKLAEVFKTQIEQGNRANALKEVFSNPDYLANFMQAAGVKLSADFIISYAGDLAMMGILDTHDDWQSLIKANLIGLAFGISGDIKDAAGVKRKPNAKIKQDVENETVGLQNNTNLDPNSPDGNIDINPNPAQAPKDVFNRSAELDKIRLVLEKTNNPMAKSPKIDLFLNELVNLAESHPEIPSEKIYQLSNNNNLVISFDRNGNCAINDFEEILNLSLNHPKYTEQILDEISNAKLDYNDIIYALIKNPKFDEIADIAGVKHALNNLKEGIIDIGKEKFDALNRSLHGEEPTELKSIRKDFKDRIGVDLKFDNNITPDAAKQYAASVEQFIARYEEAGKEIPKEILITRLVPENADGAANPSKYPDLICVAPNSNIELFNHCLFHVSVHLTDMINKRKDLQYEPIGTKLGLVDGEVKPVYDEAEANELKGLISNYVSDYATYDTNEFTAEFGSMLLENKITINSIELENGDITNEIYINEPFKTLDGKEIKVTDTVKRDIEKIIDYYFAIGGQNYPAEKKADAAQDLTSKITSVLEKSKPEDKEKINTIINNLTNLKSRYGKDTPEHTPENLLRILNSASNQDGSLNLIALKYAAARHRVPIDDIEYENIRFQKTKTLLSFGKDKHGNFDDDLTQLAIRTKFIPENTKEIFDLLKDSDGNYQKDLVKILLAIDENYFEALPSEQAPVLNLLKQFKKSDSSFDTEKIEFVKNNIINSRNIHECLKLYEYKSNYPETYDLIQQNVVTLGTRNIDLILNHIKSQNKQITPETFNNTLKNITKIPELRDIAIITLLQKRKKENPNDYCAQLYNRYRELIRKQNPNFDEQFMQLLYIEGRSKQLSTEEIQKLIVDTDNYGTLLSNPQALIESGILKDIPGRSKQLTINEILKFKKADADKLKTAIEKGLFSDKFSPLLSLQEHDPRLCRLTAGQRPRYEILSDLSDQKLELVLQYVNLNHNNSYFSFNDDVIPILEISENYNKAVEKLISENSPILKAYCRIRDLNTYIDMDKFYNIITQYEKNEISTREAVLLVENTDSINYTDLKKLKRIYNKDKLSLMKDSDIILLCRFVDFYKKTNINELSRKARKKMLKNLLNGGNYLFKLSDDLKKDFPLIPTNEQQFKDLLPSLVHSLGIKTKPLSPERIIKFNSTLSDISKELANLSDKEFANLNITQEYSKNEFINITAEKIKDLPDAEKQKVFDYFGFEIYKNLGNKTTGYSMNGYPTTSSDKEKLAQITNQKTLDIIESLRTEVIKFTEHNRIKCQNPEIESCLNDIAEVLPEIRTMIGKIQHGTHDFDVMQHSLKVLQKISQNPEFKALNSSDKKILSLAALLHDITKREGFSDKLHALNSSFDSSFIVKKFNLSKDEEIKLYTLCKNHEWLEYVNTARYKDNEQALISAQNNARRNNLPIPKAGDINPKLLEKRLQSVAFDLQQSNLLDLAVIFTHADLKAVKTDDTFHDSNIGKGRTVLADNNTNLHSSASYGELTDIYARQIRSLIGELQKSKPLTPITKIPKADVVRQNVTQINSDGSTNIKGLYMDKDGLVVIKYNEVENWELLGFAPGTTSKGIQTTGNYRDDTGTERQVSVDTGNIKFFAHGCNYSNQLIKFDAFSMVDSDALLSVTYAERPESKYRFFRTQGVLLYASTENVHGGGKTDAGSGCGKSVEDFKKRYIFGGEREEDRLFTAKIIKKVTGMSDTEYVKFVEENKNKSFTEITPIELREVIIKAFVENIVSNRRGLEREYDEFYVTNPEEMAEFTYSIDPNEVIGNPIEFLNRKTLTEGELLCEKKYPDGDLKSVYERTLFLRRHALERNNVMIVFGD